MATAADYLVSFVPFGRSIMNLRCDQARPHNATSTPTQREEEDPELVAFHQQAADLLSDLDGDDILSITWIRKLLDYFLVCQEGFRAVLFNHSAHGHLSGEVEVDRLMADSFDRAVKALDVLNTVKDDIRHLKLTLEYVDIAVMALDPRHPVFGEGQLMRARKSMTYLVAGNKRCTQHISSSAACHLKALSSSLVPPRPHEIAATRGLANAVFAMNSMLLFVAWALAAAMPSCQALPSVSSPASFSFPWATTMQSLQRRVVEASKRKGTKSACGLIVEMRQVETCATKLLELMETKRLPLGEERDEEMRRVVQEMARASAALKDGCGPLEGQVREVFHRMVRNRVEEMRI